MPFLEEGLPRHYQWKFKYPMTPLLRELDNDATERRKRRYRRIAGALAGGTVAVLIVNSGALDEPQRVDKPVTSSSAPTDSLPPVVPQGNR